MYQMKWILVLILINDLCVCKGVKDDDGNRNTWITRMRAIRGDVKNCVKTSANTTWSCLKITSLKLFDGMMSSKVIPIWRGIRLVRLTDYEDYSPIDRSHNELESGPDVDGLAYLEQIAKRLTRAIRTHALQVNLKEFTGSVFNTEARASEVHGTPRIRRHRNNMIIAMVFGVTALGAVLVPIGFQVLSVISGKALLLAKMALLLASINGLKKIANSGVHYGLYQVPGEPHAGYGYYDRAEVLHPRNIQNFITKPIEIQI